MKVMKEYENVVYKISNDFNDKVYIGVTNNFNQRYYEHSVGKDAAHSPIDKSILKHGWSHFKMEIIDHYNNLEERESKEIEYINEYNSYYNGYNATKGGDVIINPNVKGEKNPRALCTKEDVIAIRKRRMNGERLDDVYKDYKDKFPSKRGGFSKLWLHQS